MSWCLWFFHKNLSYNFCRSCCMSFETLENLRLRLNTSVFGYSLMPGHYCWQHGRKKTILHFIRSRSRYISVTSDKKLKSAKFVMANKQDFIFILNICIKDGTLQLQVYSMNLFIFVQLPLSRLLKIIKQQSLWSFIFEYRKEPRVYIFWSEAWALNLANFRLSAEFMVR